MKISIESKLLLKGLSVVKKFSGEHPIELSVSEGHLEFKATNKEVYYSYSLKKDETVNFEVKEPGAVFLSSKFEEVLRKFPGEVQVKASSKSLIISQKKDKAELALVNSSLPELPTGEEQESLKLSKKVFETLVKNTVHAASDKDSRPVLKAINMKVVEEGLRVAATDSHCLAKYSIPQKLNLPELNIPAKALSSVLDTFDEDANIELVPFGSNIILKTDEASVYIRQLDGNYPDITKLVQVGENSTIVEVDNDMLYAAVDRAMPLSKNAQGVPIITLEVLESSMNIHTNTEDGSVKGEVEVNVQKGAFEGKISVNVKYLMNALKVLSGEKVKIYLTGDNRPIYFIGKNEKLLQLVLPLRVS